MLTLTIKILHFLLPSSYADLNSANVSLVNGVVTVNLGITFKAGAPQGNY